MEHLDFLSAHTAQVPSRVLGDIVQIWEFCQRFSRQLNIDPRFSVTLLYKELEHPKNDLIDYVMSSMVTYIYTSLVTQKNTTSNYFQILEQVQSLPLRKYLIYQTWQLFFVNIGKIIKLRSIFQEDVKEQYQKLSSLILQKGFDSLAVEQKCELILFLINWVIYEIEGLGQEIEEDHDMIEEFNSGQTVKSQKQWEVQLKKHQQQLIETQDQLKKERRKQKKNKKQIENLEAQIEECKAQCRRFKRLIDYDPNDPDITVSKCKMIAQFGDLEVWTLHNDFKHFYIRVYSQDQWHQYLMDQLPALKDKLDDEELKEKLVTTLAESTAGIEPIEKAKWFDIGDEAQILIQNKFNLEFIQKTNNQDELLHRIKLILLDIEEDYSHYEMQYWKCNWTSKERRVLWRENVMKTDIQELLAIVAKFPHQLSFVNRKHALLEPPSEDQKFKSFRLYWFYQNKAYSQPYQSYSKLVETNPQILLVLVLTLYEKLKFYINKKVNQIENDQNAQITPDGSDGEIEPPEQQQQQDMEEEEQGFEKEDYFEFPIDPPPSRLRQRKTKVQEELTKTVKIQNKMEREVSQSNTSDAKKPTTAPADRILRQKKMIKYDQ